MKFKKDDLQELAELSKGETMDGFKVLRNKQYDSSRWSSHHELVFEHDGKLYKATYSQGLTESQSESPFEYEGSEIECDEVERVEKKVVKIEYVKKA